MYYHTILDTLARNIINMVVAEGEVLLIYDKHIVDKIGTSASSIGKDLLGYSARKFLGFTLYILVFDVQTIIRSS